jgi:hypothetical protein
MIAYVTFIPADTPMFSIAFTLVATPLLVFAFYLRACSLFFVRNWFYITYLAVATGMYIFTMVLLFSDKFYEHKYLSYEFTHIIASAAIGYGIALAVSAPFKLIQMIVFDTDFYLTSSMLQKIEYEAFPEKKKRDYEKKEGKFKYDTMNETQLQVELNLAVKEDRYEDAEKIKKVLEKKFKV